MMTLARANLLVLDEPTNHLDVESIEALEDAIEEYEGTVMLVSHDRAFLRELATRVWAFDGDPDRDFAGPFAEWEVDPRGARAARMGERRKAKGEGKAKGDARTETRTARRKEEQGLRGARRAGGDARGRSADSWKRGCQVLENRPRGSDPIRGRRESVKRPRVEAEGAGWAARPGRDAAMARWLESVEKVSRLATRDS